MRETRVITFNRKLCDVRGVYRSPVRVLPKALLSLRQRHRYSCTDSVSTLTVDAQMSLQSFACPLLSSALHSSEQKHAH